jgi:hypothetical protein
MTPSGIELVTLRLMHVAQCLKQLRDCVPCSPSYLYKNVGCVMDIYIHIYIHTHMCTERN